MTNTVSVPTKSKRHFTVSWNDGKVAQDTGTAGLVTVTSGKALRESGLKGGVTVSLAEYEGDKFISNRRLSVTRALERIAQIEKDGN